jgi:enoyl-CoA hydratase
MSVLVEVQGRVAVVTLNEPERRNALTRELAAELAGVIDQLESDDGVGAAVITGAGPAFCAGGDLKTLQSGDEPALRAIYESFLRVARSTLPTVAAVNGPAVGAGLNLALSCDVRLASTKALFDTRFMQLGVHPGGGNTWLLRDLGGQQLASALVLFGQALDGPAAVRVGLAWDVIEHDELIPGAVAFAQRAAGYRKELTAKTKQTILDMASIDSHPAAVEREVGDQVWTLRQGWLTV